MKTTSKVSADTTNTQFALPAIATVLLVVFFTSCQTPAPTRVPPATSCYTNTILEGDVLSISFEYSTNFNTLQKVSLDGTCNLRSVGLIKAAGKTPTELQTELATLYKKEVKDEPLTITVLSTTASVYITGSILHSGKIPLEHPMTVLEAIMEAGGFDNRAKPSEVTVVRIEGGSSKTYHVDVQRMLEGKISEPFYLKPFDILNVPTKTFNF